MFNDILEIISHSDARNFYETCEILEACINSDVNFPYTLQQIGIIPECVQHDSKEEKLFSKASDISNTPIADIIAAAIILASLLLNTDKHKSLSILLKNTGI